MPGLVRHPLGGAKLSIRRTGFSQAFPAALAFVDPGPEGAHLLATRSSGCQIDVTWIEGRLSRVQ